MTWSKSPAPTLFDNVVASSVFDVRPAVRVDDPDTSEAAFEMVKPKRAARYNTILRVVRSLGGEATCTEIADKIGVERDSVSPRLAELRLLGLVEKTALRRVPRSRPGQRATQIVWRPLPWRTV